MGIAEEMKEVYAVYCRNHDDAISLMEKVTVLISKDTIEGMFKP